MTNYIASFNNRYSQFRDFVEILDEDSLERNIKNLSEPQRRILEKTDLFHKTLPLFECDINEFDRIERILKLKEEKETGFSCFKCLFMFFGRLFKSSSEKNAEDLYNKISINKQLYKNYQSIHE